MSPEPTATGVASTVSAPSTSHSMRSATETTTTGAPLRAGGGGDAEAADSSAAARDHLHLLIASGGISTPSMAWITPLLASTSAITTVALPTITLPFITRTGMRSPFSAVT